MWQMSVQEGSWTMLWDVGERARVKSALIRINKSCIDQDVPRLLWCSPQNGGPGMVKDPDATKSEQCSWTEESHPLDALSGLAIERVHYNATDYCCASPTTHTASAPLSAYYTNQQRPRDDKEPVCCLLAGAFARDVSYFTAAITRFSPFVEYCTRG